MLILNSSCDKDEVPSVENTEVESVTMTDVNLRKETSMVFSEILRDPVVKSQILGIVHELDDYTNGASVAALLGKQDKMPEYEKKILSTGKNANLLFKKSEIIRAAFVGEVTINSKKYPNLTLNSEVAQKFQNDETEFYSSLDMEVYFPYEEEFDWESTTEYTATYDQFHEDDSLNEGVYVSRAGEEEFQGITDDYLYENPTFVVGNLRDDDYFMVDPGTGGGGDYPDTAPDRVLLKRNYDGNSIGMEDVLTTSVPRVMVYGTSWKRTLSKALRLRVVRAGDDISLKPDGTYEAIPRVFHLPGVNISASDLRNKRWVTVNWEFDPNWTMAEATQQLIVFTLRKGYSDATTTVTTKISLNSDGELTPESSITTSGKLVRKDEAILRGNKELDRNQVLSTIINGSEVDNSIINHNGIDYSIRRHDRLNFFFNHYYTNLGD